MQPESTGQVTAVIDGVRVSATPAASDRGVQLRVTGGGTVGASTAQALVASTTPVSVTLDGGAAQPSAPVTLAFDLSDRPDVVAKLSDQVVPVVESVSPTNPDERDMFLGSWNPTTKTLTTDVPHLTDFWVSALDVLKGIENGIGRTFEFLRGDSSSPCREKSELTIGDTDYVLTAVSPGAIAGCLVDRDGSVAIEFDNATGNFYSILLAPNDTDSSWLVTKPLSFGDAAGSLITGLAPNTRGVLAGRSGGRLTLSPDVTEVDVRMMPQPHGILVKSLLAGANMFGVDLKGVEDLPEAWDCFVSAVNAANVDADVTTPELVEMINGISQCLIAAEADGASTLKKAALHRLSAAVSLLTELPTQLGDFVAAGLQEAARDSVKDFQLRSKKEEPDEPKQTPGTAVIDRVDVTTWAYDRVEGDTYIADNTGAKQIEVFWKSFAGDEQVRSGCTSTVRIEGPGTNETKDSSNCDSYNPGTYLKARSAGVHTITVTVRPTGQAEIVALRTVTILPHQ